MIKIKFILVFRVAHTCQTKLNFWISLVAYVEMVAIESCVHMYAYCLIHILRVSTYSICVAQLSAILRSVVAWLIVIWHVYLKRYRKIHLTRNKAEYHRFHWKKKLLKSSNALQFYGSAKLPIF